MKIYCARKAGGSPPKGSVPGAPQLAVEVEPAAFSYRDWHLLADRLLEGTVRPLAHQPDLAAAAADRSGGISPAPRPSSPPLAVEAPTADALLEAARADEAQLVAALHEAGRKRFRADYRGKPLEADRRVVVIDLKLENVMEYEDPLTALDVYVRLAAAGVIPQEELEILEWHRQGWRLVPPDSIQPGVPPT